MRISLIFAIAACTTGTLSSAQQRIDSEPRIVMLLADLQSARASERARAFGDLRSDAASLNKSEVRAALVDLLDRENRYLDSLLEKAQRKGYPDEGDNAGWAEYYSDLLDTVDGFVDWNDPRQACILVNANSSDDSAFAVEISDHATTTIPCLVKRSESVVSMNRAVAVPVLVQALAKAKAALESATIQAAKDTILRALHDPDDGVRASTVDALGSFGGTDMIPALKELSAHDRSPEIAGRSIRKSAAAAIAKIQKRAGQN